MTKKAIRLIVQRDRNGRYNVVAVAPDPGTAKRMAAILFGGGWLNDEPLGYRLLSKADAARFGVKWRKPLLCRHEPVVVGEGETYCKLCGAAQ